MNGKMGHKADLHEELKAKGFYYERTISEGITEYRNGSKVILMKFVKAGEGRKELPPFMTRHGSIIQITTAQQPSIFVLEVQN